MKEITAKIVKYLINGGETTKTKNVEIRLCHGENPMVFEIMVKEGDRINTAVYIPYDEVRDFIFSREGKWLASIVQRNGASQG